jgi:adenosylmethionine-8-amino-7-oxononanoate aminotransferase
MARTIGATAVGSGRPADRAVTPTSNVFPRVLGRNLPIAVRSEGSSIWDADGRRYLDAAGGAIVVGIGHGNADVVRAMTEQARDVAYAHGTQFTSEALESYARDLAPLLPMERSRIYPVSGGSEAVETALKMARAYHLARGDRERHVVVARAGSYHGNTRGALDVSGRAPLRAPYLPWLGQTVHVPAAYEYRCPSPRHPDGCGAWHAERLEEAFERIGPQRVACFVAEPISGATLGAAVPTDDYWPAMAEMCRRHGVLLVMDEVMTGFGRSGTWFGANHWSVRPDLLVAGKGMSSGYWPAGLVACAGPVFDTIAAAGFVHGFTFSHHPVGAAVAHQVLRTLRDDGLIEASRDRGERLMKLLGEALADDPHVGDIRGRGLMVGVELVEEVASKRPFARAAAATERVLAAAREAGLLLYPSTGCADGTDGDLVMLGPPFVVTDEELAEAAEKTAQAVRAIR